MYRSHLCAIAPQLVIDGWNLNDNLPAAVDAFVRIAGEPVETARKIHKAFLKEYGLTPWEVPLLVYHPEHAGAPGAVFELDELSVGPPPPPTYIYQRG